MDPLGCGYCLMLIVTIENCKSLRERERVWGKTTSTLKNAIKVLLLCGKLTQNIMIVPCGEIRKLTESLNPFPAFL